MEQDGQWRVLDGTVEAFLARNSASLALRRSSPATACGSKTTPGRPEQSRPAHTRAGCNRVPAHGAAATTCGRRRCAQARRWRPGPCRGSRPGAPSPRAQGLGPRRWLCRSPGASTGPSSVSRRARPAGNSIRISFRAGCGSESRRVPRSRSRPSPRSSPRCSRWSSPDCRTRRGYAGSRYSWDDHGS